MVSFPTTTKCDKIPFNLPQLLIMNYDLLLNIGIN
jgi:hypothetical protein